jgi:hypothetical protein
MANGNILADSLSAAAGLLAETKGIGPTGMSPPTTDLSGAGENTTRQDDGTKKEPDLAELAEEIETIKDMLVSLAEAVSRLLAGTPDPNAATATEKGIEAAKDALIYAAFFQAAVRLGMSPEMVPDAWRLADLGSVSADLETKEVTGIKEVMDSLVETKPYLFSVRPADIGSETNPPRGATSYAPEVEELAAALGVSPQFAAELVKKRSVRAGGNLGIPEIWRIPRNMRLSSLDNKE